VLIALDLRLDELSGIQPGLDILQDLNKQGIIVPVIILSGHKDKIELIKELQPYELFVQERIFLKKESKLAMFDKFVEDLLGAPKPSSQAVSRWQNLQEGAMPVFCFFRIDIQDHSRLVREYNIMDVDDTLDAFEEFVEEKIKAKSGQIWSWQGDGGLCAFNMPEGVQDAVYSAMEIIGGLNEFNINRNKNKIGVTEDIKIRIAIHCGHARYRHEKGRIHSEAVNFVSHLEARKAKTNSICISGEALKELPERSKLKFEKDPELFENKEIFHLITK